jgi:hypothetical protein
MLAWLQKLIGGWLPIGTKPFGEYIGKIIWVAGCFLLFMIVWNKFTKPTTSIRPDQDAEQIVNIYHNELLRPMFGCASLKVMEYYKDKKNVATNSTVTK